MATGEKKHTTTKSTLEKTLSQFTPRREAPKAAFFFLLMFYMVASVLTVVVAPRTNTITILTLPIPLNAFAGIFSTMGNMSVILMTVFYGKRGYITSMTLTLVQIPVLSVKVFMHGYSRNLPGIFSSFLVIIVITIIFVNTSIIEKYQNQMFEHAVTDMLTGLPNVYAATQMMDDLIKRGEQFINVTINVNGFKNLNDMMGIEFGNSVLVEIGKRWKMIADSGETPTMDFIAHLGGDEYALIIRQYTSDEQAVRTIQKYEEALISKITLSDHDFYVTASFGYAEYPTDAKTVDEICSYASAAMHEVKRTNSSQHILRFNTSLLRSARYLEVEKEIREALENDTFYFNLQPQFDMNHKLRGFEALARMKDAKGNNISPGEFIPVAESAGLVDKIDGTVFRKSAGFIGKMIQEYGTNAMLSVNVSVRHLLRNDFMDEIKKVLKESGVPAAQIEIEITESIMIDSEEKALEVIRQLNALGIQLAIDDFGTGYSSLSYLHKFPAHLLKIDKSFIDKMNTGKSSRDYVAAIISIGHIMGFDVIAEGVEENDQLATLGDIKCDFVQGYIWGRPLPTEDAERLVAEYKTA